MSKGRPRQDVFFLTIAVGVLVVAVALFIGVRSLSPQAKPAAKPQAKAKEAPKRETPAKVDWQKQPIAPAKRDPFGATGAVAVPARIPGREPAPARPGPAPRRAAEAKAGVAPAPREPSATSDMRLVGITRGSSGGASVAVIQTVDSTYSVQVGGHVGDFTVAQVGTNSVVLQRGAERETLTIRGAGGGGRTARTVSRPVRRSNVRR